MRLRISWLLLGVFLLAVAAALVWPLVSAFFASDACLDSGGSYDYLVGRCDFTQNHPFIPFYSTWSFWLAMVASLTGFWAIGCKSVPHAA